MVAQSPGDNTKFQPPARPRQANQKLYKTSENSFRAFCFLPKVSISYTNCEPSRNWESYQLKKLAKYGANNRHEKRLKSAKKVKKEAHCANCQRLPAGQLEKCASAAALVN